MLTQLLVCVQLMTPAQGMWAPPPLIRIETPSQTHWGACLLDDSTSCQVDNQFLTVRICNYLSIYCVLTTRVPGNGTVASAIAECFQSMLSVMLLILTAQPSVICKYLSAADRVALTLGTEKLLGNETWITLVYICIYWELCSLFDRCLSAK